MFVIRSSGAALYHSTLRDELPEPAVPHRGTHHATSAAQAAAPEEGAITSLHAAAISVCSLPVILGDRLLVWWFVIFLSERSMCWRACRGSSEWARGIPSCGVQLTESVPRVPPAAGDRCCTIHAETPVCCADWECFGDRPVVLWALEHTQPTRQTCISAEVRRHLTE